MIGYFSANVPAGLGLYWMTSNVFSVAGSLGAKAYLKANPPKLDVELKELGLDDESAGVKVPATLEEALVDARLNAKPDRAPARPGVNPVPQFLAVDVTALDSSSGDLPDELVVVDDFAADAPKGSSVDSLYAR